MEILSVAVLSFAIGAGACAIAYRIKIGRLQQLADQIIAKADQQAAANQKVLDHTFQQQLRQQRDVQEQKLADEHQRVQSERTVLIERERKLDARQTQLEKGEEKLVRRLADLDELKQKMTKQKENLDRELEGLAGLTTKQARQQLLDSLLNQVNSDASQTLRRLKQQVEEDAHRIANTIIATAINRLTVSCVSETTVTTVSVPNDEIKGRIIGREGRNIRLLEKLTGVNYLIDDTPGAVAISGFDPLRRQIGKQALLALVQDGRIHPTSIEEAVERAKADVERQIIQSGQDAAVRAGALNLHPELISLLGRLRLRHSYGQNVLDHSLEVSHLMGLMAAELGLDVHRARRIGLLHDIGKAVSHEISGSHTQVGAQLAIRYGETQEVANGIACHHGEVEPISIEGSLCGAADALSASRPGARIEAVEEYVKRLQQLESIATSYAGVERAYAMQAGREIIVNVIPDMIDDQGIESLARDITQRIEQELNYPGKVKVTVIREKRSTQYAV